MLITSAALLLTTCLAGPVGGLERSEVVFMFGGTTDVYRSYGGTFRSWGGSANTDSPQDLAAFGKGSLDPARAAGMRYATGLAFRTAFAGMIDYDPKFLDSVTRDLDGQPILVPWLWDHKHKGHGAYWFCTNTPGYREYLKYQARRAAVRDSAGVMAEGLHIDDYGGTSGCPGGCFCPACMTAFAAWLPAHATPDDLRAAGLTTWAGFDYGAWLKTKEVTAQTVREKRWTVPLDRLYQTFQVQAARDWVAEIKRYSEQIRGTKLLLSVNSSATSADSLVIAPVIDFFCGEVDHHAERDTVPDEPVFVAKLTDQLGRGSAWTGSGTDWAYVKEKHRPGLVRTWVAQSYATGYRLMAPNHQWCYTKDKGTHWYDSQPGDYDWLYHWIRDHRDLFDGYEPYDGGTVAIYSNPAFRRWQRQLIDTVGWLTAANQPFRLALAGDDWLPNRLDPAALARAKAVVLREPASLDAEQRRLVDAQGDRLVLIPDKPDAAALAAARAKLDRLAPSPVSVEGATGVVVMPRVKAGAPTVLHVLNRNYDAATDDVRPLAGVKLRLSGDLTARRARIVAPRQPDRVVTVEGGVLALGDLALWAVVVLER